MKKGSVRLNVFEEVLQILGIRHVVIEKLEHILPRCAPSKRLRFEEQTETWNPFRLSPVEVLHRDKLLENKDYGEYVDI